MILYVDNKDCNEVKKVDDIDLQFLASQIKKLIMFVEKNITLTDKEKIVVSQLDEISKRILYRQYDTLLNDPRIVNYDVVDDDRYDEYLLDEQLPF